MMFFLYYEACKYVFLRVPRNPRFFFVLLPSWLQKRTLQPKALVGWYLKDVCEFVDFDNLAAAVPLGPGPLVLRPISQGFSVPYDCL